MSESLQKPSRDKESLALPEDIAARLGARRHGLIMQWIRDVNGAFDAALARYITSESLVLDAGCSRGDPDLPALTRSRRLVGCDVDMPGLRANRIAQDRVFAPLDVLPFRNGAFDVVVCKFVLEHVAAPARVFAEFWRVLRPGGVLAVLTPNRLSLFAAVASTLPYSFKRWLKKALFGGHEEDTFRTYYRANTPGALERLARQAGFAREHMQMLAGMWAFFIFSSPLARLVRAIERAQSKTPVIRHCSTHILGVWRKPAEAAA